MICSFLYTLKLTPMRGNAQCSLRTRHLHLQAPAKITFYYILLYLYCITDENHGTNAKACCPMHCLVSPQESECLPVFLRFPLTFPSLSFYCPPFPFLPSSPLPPLTLAMGTRVTRRNSANSLRGLYGALPGYHEKVFQ